jgi:hypothetical protein
VEKNWFVGKGASTASGLGRVIDELALPSLVAIVVETGAAISLSSEADWAGLTVKIQMIIKK